MVFSYSNLVAFCNNRNKVQQKKKHTHTHTHNQECKNMGKKGEEKNDICIFIYQNDICILE